MNKNFSSIFASLPEDLQEEIAAHLLQVTTVKRWFEIKNKEALKLLEDGKLLEKSLSTTVSQELTKELLETTITETLTNVSMYTELSEMAKGIATTLASIIKIAKNLSSKLGYENTELN